MTIENLHGQPESIPVVGKERREEPNTQLALRFMTLPTEMLDLHKELVDSRWLKLPYALSVFRRIAKRRPLVTLDKAPIPNEEIIKKNLDEKWGVINVDGCSVCGSDKATVGLKWALSTLERYPLIKDSTRFLRAQNRFFQALARLSLILPRLAKYQEKGKTLFPFTLGHEILADRKVVYPLFDCHTLEKEPCEYCQNGDENLCARFNGEKDDRQIQGFAFGFNPVLVDEEGFFITEFGGGFGEKIVVNKEAQLLECNTSFKKKTWVDSVACGWRAIGKVIWERKEIQEEISTEDPILVLGFGPQGFSTALLLKLLGFNKITVLARDYAVQQETATQLGYTVATNAETIEDKPLVVFDCIGSPESLAISGKVIKKKGIAVMSGLPQDIAIDLNPFEEKEVTIKNTYWASRGDYHKAIEILETLEQAEEGPYYRYGQILEDVTRVLPLSDWEKAFKPEREDKEKWIKAVLVPDEKLSLVA